MKHDDGLEYRLARRMQPRHIPGADETWRRLAPHLDRPRKTPGHRRAGALGLALAAVVLLGVMGSLLLGRAPGGQEMPIATEGKAVSAGFPDPTRVAVPAIPEGGGAAVPATPSQIAAPSSPVHSSQTFNPYQAVPAILPLPPFRIVAPTTLPPGLRLAAQAYSAGSAAPAATVDWVPLGPEMDPATRAAAHRRAAQLLGAPSGATLVLVYAADPDTMIEVVERAADSPATQAAWEARLQEGSVIVQNIRAATTQQDGRTLVSFPLLLDTLSDATFVDVYSTLGQEAAVGVAESVRGHPDPRLVPSTTPTTVPATVATQIPTLAQWPKTPLTSQTTREAIEQACGPWSPSSSPASDPGQRGQVVCAAKLTTGFATPSRGYNAGTYDLTWSAAAAQLGIDPALGPASETRVWLVTLDVTPQGGQAAVLDGATGTPLLALTLAPLP